jgi:hypothetical protein
LHPDELFGYPRWVVEPPPFDPPRWCRDEAAAADPARSSADSVRPRCGGSTTSESAATAAATTHEITISANTTPTATSATPLAITDARSETSALASGTSLRISTETSRESCLVRSPSDRSSLGRTSVTPL